MAEVKPAEVSAILKQSTSGITNATASLDEVGRVLTVGDGIATCLRTYQMHSTAS